jgi:hypothetical protein
MPIINNKLKCIFIFIGLIVSSTASAGIFDLPSFIDPGKLSVGIEPEVIISKPTGAGFNVKPRLGISDLLNVEGIIGTGTGSRKFRIGAIAGFDWFPDVGNQPGIATPIKVEYLRFEDDGVLSYGVQPLVYKTFKGDAGDFTPFVALPIGWNLRNSKNQGFMQVAFGSMFKLPENNNYRFVLEAGFNINHSYSYISGGVTYYP